MAVYEERVEQDLIVGESLQLFRDQERIYQFTSKESQNVQPVIRNLSKGQVSEIIEHFNFFFFRLSLNCPVQITILQCPI